MEVLAHRQLKLEEKIPVVFQQVAFIFRTGMNKCPAQSVVNTVKFAVARQCFYGRTIVAVQRKEQVDMLQVFYPFVECVFTDSDACRFQFVVNLVDGSRFAGRRISLATNGL